MLTMPGLKSVLVMILHIPCQVCLWLLKTLCLYSNNNILLWPTWNRKVSLLQFLFQRLCKKPCFLWHVKLTKSELYKHRGRLHHLAQPPLSSFLSALQANMESLAKQMVAERLLDSQLERQSAPCPIMQTRNTARTAGGVDSHTESSCWLWTKNRHKGWNNYNFPFHIFLKLMLYLLNIMQSQMKPGG